MTRPALPAFIFLLLTVVACSAAAPDLDVGEDAPGVDGEAPGVLPADFDLQAHRGGAGLRPESTLQAFETALDLEVTTLELDLHWSADGMLVVWHDARLSPERCRLDPAAQAPLPPDPDDPDVTSDALAVRALTVEQLGKYLCDRNPDAAQYPVQEAVTTALAGGDYRIVTLEALLDFVDSYAANDSGKTEAQRSNAQAVRFNVETKRDPENPETIGDGFDGVTAGPFEWALMNLLESRGLAQRMMVQSFDHRSLKALRAEAPDLALSALTRLDGLSPEGLAAEGFAVWSPFVLEVSPTALSQAHAVGLKVIPWTVNTESDMHRLIRMGVDGIITDRPDLLVEVVQSYR